MAYNRSNYYRTGNHATNAQNTERVDWSSEITPVPQNRAASDTGLGGIQRDETSMGSENAQSNRTDRTTNGNNRTGREVSNGVIDRTGREVSNGIMERTGNDLSSNAIHRAANVMNRMNGINGVQVMNGRPTDIENMMDDDYPDIENNLPDDVIEAPTTLDEVYRGSLKALLLRNIGNYVVATFLIGTQTTVSWEGILYDVGNDYLAIYQSGRDQYIVSDLYSLKYVEFYDTRRRELCDAILEQAEENAQ